MTWKNEPIRHSLARRGIPTTARGKDDSSFSTSNLLKTAVSLLGLGREEMPAYAKIKNFNAHANKRTEWIADLDLTPSGRIEMMNTQFSEKNDESNLDWNDQITNKDPYSDPERCIGYMHYHPSSVDEKFSAQDYILAMTIDKLRNQNNKERYSPTVMGVTTDDRAKFIAFEPNNPDDIIEKFKEIQNKDYSPSENDKYFNDIGELKNKLRKSGQLKETDWLPLDGDDK